MRLKDITPTEILEENIEIVTITAEPHPRAEFWFRQETNDSGYGGDQPGFLTVAIEFKNAKSFIWDPWAGNAD